MTEHCCKTCARADCADVGLVETCLRWTNTDDDNPPDEPHELETVTPRETGGEIE